MFKECKCFWCEKLKWPLLRDLNNNQNHYWFEIPRSGSVTIKESFKQSVIINRNTKEFEIAKTKSPIVIVSDPVNRFISCINAYLAENQRYYAYGKNIFSSFGVDLDLCERKEKIDMFFDNIDKINSQHQVHHFHPQIRFIDTENFSNFTVLRRYQINQYFGIGTHLNHTRKEITVEDLSYSQIEIVKNIYEDDYKFLRDNGKT